MVRFYANNGVRAELKVSYVLCVEVYGSVFRFTTGPSIQALIPRTAHANVHNLLLGDLQGITIISKEHKWFERGLKEVFYVGRKLDLFKSLVVLWIVNTVNELIHLRHIIHQNPLYVPICP